MFKVGLTRRDPSTRADELSGTGTIDRLLVVHQWEVGDCRNAEARIHDALAPFRITGRREFFEIDLHRLVDFIENVLSDAV